MSEDLSARIEAALNTSVRVEVQAFAARLGEAASAQAVLFYGSNLRTGELEGVLDFYVLEAGPAETGLWPRVSYQEWEHGGQTLRAKIATMSLAKFAQATRGESTDTTIWARFVQPSTMAWCKDAAARAQVAQALADAAKTASRLAVALGPDSGTPADYWRALFRATYKAELRVEKPGRENNILEVNAAHFDGLLPAALAAQDLPFTASGDQITPQMADRERREILRWWNRCRRMGKPLNIARLIRATRTFDGAGRYAAWKIERHTGVKIEVTPWREKHPILMGPYVLWKVWRAKRS